MKRTLLLLAAPACLALGITAAFATQPAHATASAAVASDGPGCYPEYSWSSAFLNPLLDPNNHLVPGEWTAITNGRIHQFEVMDVDAASGSFWGQFNGEDIQGVWEVTERKLTFSRTHANGKGGTTTQDFVAYIMDVNPEDPKIRMAGTVTREAPPITNYDHPDRLTYGFVATLER